MSTQSTGMGLGVETRLLLRRGGQVWRLVPPRHKAALCAAALVILGVSICNTALPLLLGQLVDDVQKGVQQGFGRSALYAIALGVLGLIALVYGVREGLNVLRRYLVENTCTRVNSEMSVRLVAHLLKVDLAALSREKIGALNGRIFRSVDGYMRFLRIGFLDFFPALFTGALALTVAVVKQPWLGAAMAGVIPMSVYLTVRQLMSQKGVRLGLMRACEEIDGALVEQLGGMEYVRVADTHRQEAQRLARATERRRAQEIRHHFQMALFGCAKALNEGFFHILMLAAAIYLAVDGRLSFGDVLTFSILYLNVMAPLSEIHRVLDEGHEASLRVGDLLEMLNEPIDRSFSAKKPAPKKRFGRAKSIVPHMEYRPVRLTSGAPAIEIEELRAEYVTPAGRQVRALDGLNLTIRHGETIGVAGRSGGGKSTWIKVLLRLTHPSSGRVIIGGVPLDLLSRAEIGRIFGYVGQTPFVFSGTIAENIAYGNDKATPEAVRRAAELANLHDEILAMPGEYDALVTERGQNLSGGQRQRLALARMLLKEAPILILDEATSALDNISERHVQRSLGIKNSDRMTILVAHRLSTLRDADRIFVFDGGRIVEVGSYHELLQQAGVFAELVMSAEHGVDACPSLERAAAAVS